MKQPTKTEKKDEYTNEELRLFERLSDDLCIWLFCSNDNKRYAITKIIKEAYNRGKHRNTTL